MCTMCTQVLQVYLPLSKKTRCWIHNPTTMGWIISFFVRYWIPVHVSSHLHLWLSTITRPWDGSFHSSPILNSNPCFISFSFMTIQCRIRSEFHSMVHLILICDNPVSNPTLNFIPCFICDSPQCQSDVTNLVCLSWAALPILWSNCPSQLTMNIKEAMFQIQTNIQTAASSDFLWCFSCFFFFLKCNRLEESCQNIAAFTHL